MLLPLLSEVDPRVSAEGSIDPLGIYLHFRGIDIVNG